MPTPKTDSPLATTYFQRLPGLVIAILGFFSFALSDVTVKDLGHRFGLIPLAGLLSLTAFFSIVIFAFFSGGLGALKTSHPRIHLLRSILLLCSGLATFFALPRIPLTQFYLIVFTMPFWTLIVARVFLGRSIQLLELVSVGLGFLGVVIAVRLSDFILDPTLIVLSCSPPMFAAAQLLSRSLPVSESPLSLGFYPRLFSLLVFIVPAVSGLDHLPSLIDIVILIVSGILQALGIVLTGVAFQRTSPAIAGFAQYTQAFWGTIFGLMLFGEVPHLRTILGLAIIIAASFMLHPKIREKLKNLSKKY